MTKKEEEAIKVLKQPTELAFIDCERENAIGIVLRLIKKQQKEIEELEHRIKFQRRVLTQYDNKISKYENGEVSSVIDLDKFKEFDEIGIKGKRYISKDKIRKTIEDLEKHRIMSSDDFTIKVLRDLLKE